MSFKLVRTTTNLSTVECEKCGSYVAVPKMSDEKAYVLYCVGKSGHKLMTLENIDSLKEE